MFDPVIEKAVLLEALKKLKKKDLIIYKDSLVEDFKVIHPDKEYC